MSKKVEIDILAHVDNALSGIGKLITSVTSAYMGIQGLKKAFEFGKESFEAFNESEQTFIKLTSAIRAAGQSMNISAESLNDYATEMSLLTTFEDDAIVGAEGVLISIGNLTEKGIKQALPVLADYASAMGIDIATAAETFSQAIAGGRNAFAKYGISVTDAKDSTQRFDIILKGLNDRFSGTAKAIAETTGGQLTIFNNQIGNLKETLGGLIAESLNPLITKLNTFLQTINTLNTLTAAFDADRSGTANTQQKITVAEKMLESFKKQAKEAREEIAKLQKLQRDLGSAADLLMPGFGSRGGVNEILKGYYKDLSLATQGVIDFTKELADLKKQTDDVNKAAAKTPAVFKEVTEEFDGMKIKALPIIDTVEAIEQKIVDVNYESGRINITWEEMQSNIRKANQLLNEQDSTVTHMSRMDQYRADRITEFTLRMKEQTEEVQALQGTFASIAGDVESIAGYLAESDWGAALNTLIDSIGEAIVSYATLAAAKAFVSGDYASFFLWAGIAGLAIAGMTLADVFTPSLTAGSDSSSDAGTTSGSSYKSGGGNTIIVQGSVWSAGDLAKEISRSQGRW